MTTPPVSMLYMPGANARALEKARSLDVDAVILDLEDAVAPEAKQTARETIKSALDAASYTPRQVIIRINALDTEWANDDIDFVTSLDIDGVLVPKINTAQDLLSIRDHLGQRGASDLPLWAMVETPLCVLNLAEIGASAKSVGLVGLVAGTNDLTKEMDAAMLADRSNLVFALSALVTTAKAYGLAAIDGVFNDISDTERLKVETRQGRDMGFDGKTLIHPSQIDICHQVYAPTENEVKQANAIIAAFDSPENAGKGVLKIGGQMAERLHYDMARKLIHRMR